MSTHLIDSSVGWEISNTNLSTGWCSLSMMTTTTFSASFWKRIKQTLGVERQIVIYSTSLTTRSHRHLLNERLHTVKSILNILVQLWVA